MIVFVIKQLRESKGISQYKLSQMTDISRTYIRNLENNKKCNPSLHILSLVAEALEVDIKDLFYTKLDIENLRKKMHRKINKYGLDSKEVLEVSRIIDLLTNLLNTEK